MEKLLLPPYLVVGLLLAVYLWMLLKLVRRPALSYRQRGVKIILNTVLFLLVALLLYPPSRAEQGQDRVMVAEAGIPRAAVDSVKGLYKITREMNVQDIRAHGGKRLFFFGQRHEPAALSHLAGSYVQWIPYFPPGTLEDIQWEGILRKGERQTVRGKIRLERGGVIRLLHGDVALDSLVLHAGFNAFRLVLPVNTEGRNAVRLQLDDRLLHTIAFYVRPVDPMHIVLLPDYPDMESRILAEWLGAQGHQVEIFTPVARSVQYEGRINAPVLQRTPDLVMATPARAGDSRVKKAIADNKSVLFFGLGDVNAGLALINRATGTNFSTRRSTTAESRALKNELTALPYEFKLQPNQRALGHWPVVLQRGGVAVSLLNETFPARFRGDTLTYTEIWTEILSALNRSDSLKVRMRAPIVKGVPAGISALTTQNIFLLSEDSLFLHPTVAHPAKKNGVYHFKEEGWQRLPSAGEVFVEEAPPTSHQLWENWLKANATLSKSEILVADNYFSSLQWFLIFLLCFMVLWLESKFIY